MSIEFRIAWVAASLVAVSAAGAWHPQTTQSSGSGEPPAVVTAEPSAAGAESPAASDRFEWPREFTTELGTTVVYQPQIDAWVDYERLEARAAIVVTLAGNQSEPRYGAMSLTARTTVDHDARLVRLSDLVISDVRFPGVAEEDGLEALAEQTRSSIVPQGGVDIGLDRIVTALERTELATREIAVGLAPPPIHWRDRPAALVIFMGPARFEPVAGTTLFYAVNTNWDLFLDAEAQRWYLLRDRDWYVTADLAAGPWMATASIPAGFAQLPEDENWAEVRASFTDRRRGPDLDVIVSEGPAELILTDGAPEFVPIEGTLLQAVSNTESDLFVDPADSQYYLLVAGRWFRAASLMGPWASATTDLPAAFLDIPEDGSFGYVLPSVPGSPDARAAQLLASVPRTATVSRQELSLTVVWDGEPQFRPIDGSSVLSAVNTAQDVFLVEGVYYCCERGVWFAGLSPQGPWIVWDEIPDVIYAIPSTSPRHHVTYVRVYDSTPDTVVVGHTGGYTGQYLAFGVVMFGLGYAIADDWGHHWHHHHHHHVHWYSYGCHARYSYASGGYYRAAGAYGPYGGAGRAAAWNPRTGTYARGAARYGPRGGAAAYQAWNPFTDRSVTRVGATDGYRSWGRSVVTSGDEWARTASRSGPRGRAGAFETSRGAAGIGLDARFGGSGAVVRDRHGDLYVGRDGNVFRRTDDGWQQRSGRNWTTASGTDRTRTRATGTRAGAGAGAGATAPADATRERIRERQATTGRQRDLDRERTVRTRSDRRVDTVRRSGSNARSGRTTGGSRSFGGRSSGGRSSGSRGGRRGGR